MKLITFDAQTLPTQRKGEAVITLSRKAASSISKAAVELMQMGGGSSIAIHQDEENPEDWYISQSEAGFKLRDGDKGGCLFFNNTTLANTILDALSLEDNRVGFRIAREPTTVDEVEYWAIITAKPIVKTRKKK